MDFKIMRKIHFMQESTLTVLSIHQPVSIALRDGSKHNTSLTQNGAKSFPNMEKGAMALSGSRAILKEI